MLKLAAVLSWFSKGLASNDAGVIRRHAEQFSVQRFHRQIAEFVGQVLPVR